MSLLGHYFKAKGYRSQECWLNIFQSYLVDRFPNKFLRGNIGISTIILNWNMNLKQLNII